MSFTIPDVFLINYGSIDEEHQRLVSQINELLEISQNGSAHVFENAFETLIAKFETHFLNEEALMKDAGYDGLEWHGTHHEEALAELRALYEACQTKGEISPSDIYVCFDQVIKDVAKADLKFGEFLDATNGRRY